MTVFLPSPRAQEEGGVPRPDGGTAAAWELLTSALARAGAAPRHDGGGALCALVTQHETPSVRGGTRRVDLRCARARLLRRALRF